MLHIQYYLSINEFATEIVKFSVFFTCPASYIIKYVPKLVMLCTRVCTRGWTCVVHMEPLIHPFCTALAVEHNPPLFREFCWLVLTKAGRKRHTEKMIRNLSVETRNLAKFLRKTRGTSQELPAGNSIVLGTHPKCVAFNAPTLRARDRDIT